METEVNHKLPFLDILLDNSNPAQPLVTSFSAGAPTQAFSPIF